MNHWIVFLFIHVAIPAIGIGAYAMLTRKIKQEQTPKPPIMQLFWLFGLYGVVIILILTSLIGKWSGMASLGGFASVSVGPIIAGIIAFKVFENRSLTKYHKLTFWLSIGYLGLVFLVISASVIYNAF